MPEPQEVDAETLAAFVLGDLAPDAATRVRAALDDDPTLAAEVAELRAALELFDDVEVDDLDTPAPEPPAGLADRVAEQLARERAERHDVPDRWGRTGLAGDGGDGGAGAAGGGVAVGAGSATAADMPVPAAGGGDDAAGAEVRPFPPAVAAARSGSARSGAVWLRVAAPAAAVVLVAAIAVGVLRDGGSPAPGLGVDEPIAFDVTADGLAVDARLVPHTWGTEVFLEMTGTVDGEIYRVDLEATDGTTVSAGTFLGDDDLEVVCVMNGALLREDTVAVTVTTADGTPVMRAPLDPVDYRSV